MFFQVMGLSLVILLIALMAQPQFRENYRILSLCLVFVGNFSQVELVISGMLILIVIGVYLVKTLFLRYSSRTFS